MVLVVSSTLIIGTITGFLFFSDDEFFFRVAEQVAHGSLSIAWCALVGVAFWRFDWRVGVIDLALVFIASNASLTLCRYFKEGSGL